MDSSKKNLLNQHKKPMSRREFVSLGLAAAGGFAFAPTLFHSLKRAQAFAAGLPLPGAENIPFITFDLAGGVAMPGNFLVGGAGGALDLLPSYSTLGWDPKLGYDNRFGLPMAKVGTSKMLEGMLSVMSPEAQANFRMASILHTSRDDTGDNPLSIAHLVSSSGCKGTTIGSGVGLRQTPSGGNSRSVLEISEFNCRYVTNLEDLLQANAVSAPLASLGKTFVSKVFAQVHSLSNTQAQAALSLPSSSDTLKLIDQRLSGAELLSVSASDLDPRKNAVATTLYALNPATPETDPILLRAGLVYGAITGATGPAVVTIAGCDYHDGTQTTGDAKDLEIGKEIGRAVELAHQMKRPLFLHLLTDGGIAAVPGSRKWQGDNGEKSMSVMGYYHPDHVPTYVTDGKFQVGAYTPGQGADRSTFFGASPALAGYAVFANYLNVSGRIGEFDVLANRPITNSDLPSVLVLGS